MSPNRILPITGALLIASTAPLLPQAAEPGTRVRVTRQPTAGAGRQTGTLQWSSADSLAVQLTTGEMVTLPWDAVARVERYAGRHSNAGQGAAVGATLGALLAGGAYAIAAKGSGACSGGFSVDLVCGGSIEPELLVASAGLGLALGGLFGAGIGAASQGDRWTTVSTPTLRAGLTLHGGAPALAMRIEW